MCIRSSSKFEYYTKITQVNTKLQLLNDDCICYGEKKKGKVGYFKVGTLLFADPEMLDYGN